MNAEQVLRDMRVCFIEGECNNCSRIDDEDCVDGLCKDIIALIKSLQSQLAEYTATGLTPGDVKDMQGLCKENGLAKYVDLIVKAKRQMSKANEPSIEQAERIEQLESQLAESRRREKAAVADLQAFVEHPCGVCIHLQDQQFCYKNCQDHDRENHRAWQWRGPSDGEAHHDA